MKEYFQKIMKSLVEYDFHGNKADTLSVAPGIMYLVMMHLV